MTPNLLKDDPHAGFHVICARTFEEAIESLVVDAQTRWSIIDCTQELHRHHDFIGRRWLKEQVQTFVNSPDSSYLLLIGGPGVGKSAFVAEQVRDHKPPMVFHFIKRGMGNWDEPEAILGSLTARLRRNYALPESEAEQHMTASAAFFTMLQRVSRELSGGQKEVIYLDGLDEAFGPTGRFAQVALPGILPSTLPEGIVMVLTSRPGEHLNWLADPTVCKTIVVDPDASVNLDDTRAYLHQQNETRKRCVTTLFFDRPFIVAFVGTDPPRLIVADHSGQTFGYEVLIKAV